MFDTMLNHALLSFRLRPAGPVLIRRGGHGTDPSRPDLEWVRTSTNGQETVYLPGSSLKGVIRAHAERLLRGMARRVCDPFDHHGACQKTGGDGAETYSSLCAACRTFGSLSVAGRVRIGDALPVPQQFAATNRTEVRHGVALSRDKQDPVRGALFDLEAVTEGAFQVRVLAENYETWQLGLVLQVLDDLHAGLIQIGSGKSRGFGDVTVEDLSADLRVLGKGPKDRTLPGAGALLNTAEAERHDLDPSDHVALPEGVDWARSGVFARAVVPTGTCMDGLRKVLATDALARFATGSRLRAQGGVR